MWRRVLNIASMLVLVTVTAAISSAQVQGFRGQCPFRGGTQSAETGQPCFTGTDPVTIEGVVETVNIQRGQGFPNFTIMRADGVQITIVLSPYRAVQDAGFKIAANDRVSVLAYASQQLETTFVAAQLQNLTTGATLMLRDAEGYPVAGCGGRGRRGGCCRQGQGGN